MQNLLRGQGNLCLVHASLLFSAASPSRPLPPSLIWGSLEPHSQLIIPPGFVPSLGWGSLEPPPSVPSLPDLCPPWVGALLSPFTASISLRSVE